MAANYKLMLILLFVSFFLTPFAAALGNMDFSLSVPTGKIIPYTGGQTNAEGALKNENWACDIECTYLTSQGYSGNTGTIGHRATIPFIYTVSAPEGTISPINVQITFHCVAPQTECGFEGSKTGYTSVNFNYCGDGTKQSQENCGNCLVDAPCISGYHCKDTNCVMNCNDECSSDQKECVGTTSYKTCQTDTNGCYKWGAVTSCGNDYACSNGECITITSDENCGAIDKHCNTNTQESSTGNTYCSSDSTKAISVLEVTKEKCVNKQCQKDVTNQNKETDCTKSGTYCQDGKCGCKAGFDVCGSLKRCIEIGNLELNSPCSCDFQCQSGICQNGNCINGLTCQFSSVKTAIKPGETTDLTLTVMNPFESEIGVDMTVSLESGSELSGVFSGGDSCAGNQCTSSVKISAKNQKDIAMRIAGTNLGNINLKGAVRYSFKGKSIEVPLSETIYVTKCGEVECKQSPVSFIRRILDWFASLF